MERRRPLIGACAALALGMCSPVPHDPLPPEVARAVATRVASSSAERSFAVLDAVGDSALSFATNQALTTAGLVVRDSTVLRDSTFTVLHFDAVTGGESTWVVRTRRTTLADAASVPAVEWRVHCARDSCMIRDSAIVIR